MARLFFLGAIVVSLCCAGSIPCTAQQSSDRQPTFVKEEREVRPQEGDPFGIAAKAKRDVVVRQGAVADIPAAQQRIRHELKQLTSLKAIELPLSEVVREISSQHRIPVVINNRPLEEIGLSSEEPVTLYMEDVSLRSALRLLLQSYDLTYVVKDEVLQITTVEDAKKNLVVRVFSIPEGIADNADEFVKVMKASVAPNLWDQLDGPCTAHVVGDMLIVSATEDGLEMVDDFLAQIAARPRGTAGTFSPAVEQMQESVGRDSAK